METIQHKTVSVNGINMHVAEKGPREGGNDVVLFLHGFPELWYTWRHQILALSAAGYRAVAPDLRGYGDTDAPATLNSYTYFHIVGDLVALIEWLGVDRVYLVGHDWGAWIGWYLCMFRPDKVKAYVSLSVPFRPRHPKFKPVQAMTALFGEDFYMCRFQEPGKIEAEIASYGSAEILKRLLVSRKPGPSCLPKEDAFGPKVLDTPIPLPSWFSEEDLKYNADKFDQKGFTGGLNYYRSLDMNWELMAPWTGAKVRVPTKFIVGDEDMVYTTPGIKEYVHGGGFKNDVPMLEEVVVMPGAAHFINQEKPEEINAHILDFIKKF